MTYVELTIAISMISPIKRLATLWNKSTLFYAFFSRFTPKALKIKIYIYIYIYRVMTRCFG